MKKKDLGYIVYHYELMNDGREILLFEPNVFNSADDAEKHCSILEYLSGREFSFVLENQISKLDLLRL